MAVAMRLPPDWFLMLAIGQCKLLNPVTKLIVTASNSMPVIQVLIPLRWVVRRLVVLIGSYASGKLPNLMLAVRILADRPMHIYRL